MDAPQQQPDRLSRAITLGYAGVMTCIGSHRRSASARMSDEGPTVSCRAGAEAMDLIGISAKLVLRGRGGIVEYPIWAIQGARILGTVKIVLYLVFRLLAFFYTAIEFSYDIGHSKVDFMCGRTMVQRFKVTACTGGVENACTAVPNPIPSPLLCRTRCAIPGH
jgi:hypothetical protein